MVNIISLMSVLMLSSAMIDGRIADSDEFNDVVEPVAKQAKKNTAQVLVQFCSS